MKTKKITRNKWLTVRMSDEEEKKLYQLYEKTTCNSMSEYTRDILLKQPVYVLYRNQSADDFLLEMLELKKELNAIGHNFNQVVHKLHILDHDQEIKAWAAQNEFHKKIFFEKIDEIKEKLNQIYELWSQK
ncbi:MAG TPA: hypothetical protein VNT20_05115 [Flavisolibacter sp.]|jgi:hypothetical protein|nr:hypothetical protein [Flavisolibacter sp.]